MADDVLTDYILHGREERYLEYKSSFPWSKRGARPRARAIKTVLALANIPDGGVVVIGVEENSGVFTPVGMTAAHASKFTQDQVQADVNDFADPYIQVTVSPCELEDAKSFVVIQVRPFDAIPVICRKDGSEGLRRGAMYTRALRKNETVEVPSQSEMREIVDRAVDSGVRQYLERASRVGLVSFESAQDVDARKFAEQLGKL